VVAGMDAGREAGLVSSGTAQTSECRQYHEVAQAADWGARATRGPRANSIENSGLQVVMAGFAARSERAQSGLTPNYPSIIMSTFGRILASVQLGVQPMKRLGIALAIMICGLSATASLAADDSIKNIQDSGVLRVGMASAPPYQSPNPATGEYEGYNVDMAKGVAAVLGVKLQIVDSSWSTLVPGLLDHKYDVIMANIFATPERALVVTFTQPYFLYGLDVIVKTDGPIKTMDDLKKPGVVFSGLSGGVDATYPAQIYPDSKTNALVSDDPSASVLQVLNGQADAAMVDPSLYLLLRGKNPAVAKGTMRLNTDAEAIRRTALCWAVRPEDQRLVNFLNVFIQSKVSTGESDALQAKWYHTLEAQQ